LRLLDRFNPGSLLGHNIRKIRREFGKCIRGEIKGRWQLVVRKGWSLNKDQPVWGKGCFW